MGFADVGRTQVLKCRPADKGNCQYNRRSDFIERCSIVMILILKSRVDRIVNALTWVSSKELL